MKEARQIGHVGGDVRLETREWNMKFKLAIPTIVILLLISFPALANNARPFFLRTPVTMNGAEVPAGLYELRWEEHNSKVQVTLWKEGRFFATARGNWVKSGVIYTGDAALLRVNSDGSRSLTEIRLAGVKKSIVIDETFNSTLQVRAK
jgi:hypothetical protein